MVISDLWSAIGAKTGITSTQLAHGLTDLSKVMLMQA
ncbi:hypothetical protein SAMN04489742_1367 [Arthrobacter crystallopoietes]|uniref:Uncharacterized protein n=1 Tax=Crystallibacter crystallopoietes TaxID=37928 RepID=A0A1H1BE63_9MICC|nr:hypothetical protein SAMN04489742_1367 [Arthrobacter crystallopoietes]